MHNSSIIDGQAINEGEALLYSSESFHAGDGLIDKKQVSLGTPGDANLVSAYELSVDALAPEEYKSMMVNTIVDSSQLNRVQGDELYGSLVIKPESLS